MLNDASVLRVDRKVVTVGFVADLADLADLADEAEGDIVLGLLGWAAYRLAGVTDASSSYCAGRPGRGPPLTCRLPHLHARCSRIRVQEQNPVRP